MVAEYAIAMAKKHMTRTIYTSPIKALRYVRCTVLYTTLLYSTLLLSTLLHSILFFYYITSHHTTTSPHHITSHYLISHITSHHHIIFKFLSSSRPIISVTKSTGTSWTSLAVMTWGSSPVTSVSILTRPASS